MKDRYFNLLSDDRKNCFEKNKQWLVDHPDIFKSIRAFYQDEKYPEVLERDIDSALYSIAFPTALEENLFRQFHAAKPDKKSTIAKQFPNSIRQVQAMRIIARHFPDYLSDADRITFTDYLHSQPVDFRGEKKLTRDAALLEINELQKKALDDEQQKLLGELKLFLHAN